MTYTSGCVPRFLLAPVVFAWYLGLINWGLSMQPVSNFQTKRQVSLFYSLQREHLIMDGHEEDSVPHRDWRTAVSDLYHRDSKSREGSSENKNSTDKNAMAEDDEGRKSPSSQLGAFM